MDLAIDLISVIFRIAVDIVLFSRISGRKFTIKDCPLVLLIYLLFPTILTFLEQSFYSKFNILDYLLEPFRISVLAFVYMRGLPISLILFYGLSSSILQNLFYRFHSFFLFPIWDWDNSMLEITSYWIVFYFSSFIGAMWFIRLSLIHI